MVGVTNGNTNEKGQVRQASILFAPRWPRSWILFAAVVLTLLAFGVRFYNLALDSFWIDEIITLRNSLTGVEGILKIRDHPPLLYFLTSASTDLFGVTEFAARLPSMLVSLPAISLLIVLGRAFRHPLAGILAALLLALSPFHLRHSQEARHYALLMTFSLATYVLLYLAMKKPSYIRWIAYGLATTLNLYTHYGAFVVLAVQGILIAGWSIRMIWKKEYRRLLFPASATLTVILLYAIQIPRIQRAFGRTFSDSGGVRHSVQADLGAWLRSLYAALGTQSDILAPLLVGLSLVGIGLLIYRHEWRNLIFSVMGLVMPLVLINITGVDRTSNARYVIHLLPFFLLLAAIALSEFCRSLCRRAGATAGLLSLASITGLLILMSIPLVQAEYDYAIHDWSNIAQALNERGEDGDIVVTMTLSLDNGYNVAAYSLRYYLDQGEKQFHMVAAGVLNQRDIEELLNAAPEDAKVWGVVMYWGSSEKLSIPGWEDSAFKGFTHLLQNPLPASETLMEILTLYTPTLPLANKPFPHCLLKQDMAIIRQNMGDLLPASTLMAAALNECPEASSRGLAARRPAIIESLFGQILEEFDEAKLSGRPEEIRELALAVLLQQPANEDVKPYLKFADLLELFDQGLVEVVSTAPEPVRRASFGMPPNNYDGDVLFLHPPSQVTYELTLPEEPTVFLSQIGMVPDSWEWGGDGSTFVVVLETEEGSSEELFRQHVSNELVDRYWQWVEIPLGKYGGQEVKLTLKTEPGPAGNETGDWAIWDEPAVWWDTGAEISRLLYR